MSEEVNSSKSPVVEAVRMVKKAEVEEAVTGLK